MKKKILISVLVLFAFGYGLIVGKYQVFPYSEVKYIKNSFFDNAELSRQTYIKPKDNPLLPNVLIIGDSISIGYTQDVSDALNKKPDIFRIPVNGGNTVYGVKHIKEWLGNYKWDIIHFNWGLHDIKAGKTEVSEKEYKKNLTILINEMQKTNATLIWCSTTPLPEMSVRRRKGDEVKYNLIAKKIMDKNNIQINDLYSYASKNIENIQHPDNVHFTLKGSKYLSIKVVTEISKELK